MDSTVQRFNGLGVIEFSCISILLIAISYVGYNFYIHPLARFPGPRLAGMTPIWAMRSWMSGQNVRRIKSLHDQYGPVVRVSPNQLSFSSATAWKDIYGHVSGRKPFIKGGFYEGQPGQERTLVSVFDPAEHAAMRKTLSHGFSASALSAQEDLIQHYVDLLVHRLYLLDGETANIVRLYNFTTFDIIGELSFGKPFGALEAGQPHYWMDTFFASMKALTLVRVFEFLPSPLRTLCRRLWRANRWSSNTLSAAARQAQYSREQVLGRLKEQPPRTDFLTKMIADREKNNISLQQLTAQAGMLVRAGSETTATSLSALTYYLCHTPRVLEKLVKEIRGRFSSYEEIDGHSVGSLAYLSAVIDEGLRLFPPFAMGLPRVSPGETVDGHFIPRGVVVYVTGWAAGHSEMNFHRPEEFLPERWTDPECTDVKAASQPFSLGARGCLGRNLAIMDIRLILAKILWTFDMKMDDQDFDWVSASKSYVTWEKAELHVRLTPRAQKD